MATVTVQQKRKPRLGRINDTAIMDCLTAANQFSRGELHNINRYRIYMRVFFLSYITHIQGILIETWEISGKRQTTRTSAWAWPVQQRPTDWKAWKDAIEFFAPERTVIPSLGAWIKQFIIIQTGSGRNDKHKTLDALGFARKAHPATIPQEPLTL
jgi:hypothetical protein